MTNAYHRKKQPDVVRRTLLDCAAKLAVERGLKSVTVQAVAEAAGVTKGGLFHHFPNKQALIDAVLRDLFEQFDEVIDSHMAKDKQAYGRFTRAYVEATFGHEGLGINSTMSAMAISALTDPEMNRMCSVWMTDRLGRHHDTDSAPILEIVRLAADGAWAAHVLSENRSASPDSNDLRLRLLALTQLDQSINLFKGEPPPAKETR